MASIEGWLICKVRVHCGKWTNAWNISDINEKKMAGTENVDNHLFICWLFRIEKLFTFINAVKLCKGIGSSLPTCFSFMKGIGFTANVAFLYGDISTPHAIKIPTWLCPTPEKTASAFWDAGFLQFIAMCCDKLIYTLIAVSGKFKTVSIDFIKPSPAKSDTLAI